MQKIIQNPLKNKPYNGPQSTKKVWLMVLYAPLLMIFLLSLISAFEFDNIKSYDDKDRSIIIKNSFLGLPLDEVAKVTPLTPHDMYVIRGSDRLVAEFQLDIKDDYTEGVFDGMEFFNKNEGDKEITRDYKIKYLKETLEIPTPTTNIICDDTERWANGSNKCREIKGEVINYKKVWEELDKNADLPKGIITIGVFADVNTGDYVEFIPTWFGIRMPEYSTWSDSYNVDLELVYKLEGGYSGYELESVDGIYNASVTAGVIQGVKGKIGNALQFNKATDENLTLTDTTTLNLDIQTINTWISPNESTGIIMSAVGGSGRIYIDISGGNFRVLVLKEGGGNSGYVTTPYIINEWQMISLVLNGTTLFLYHNGTLKGNIYYGDMDNPVEYGCLGFDCSTGGTRFNGTIDELYFWSRNISAEDIADIYASTTGYLSVFSPVVTLNSPLNDFNTTSTTIAFNCSAISIPNKNLTNISLYIDGAINYTQSLSDVNFSELSISRTFTGIQEYNWTFKSIIGVVEQRTQIIITPYQAIELSRFLIIQ